MSSSARDNFARYDETEASVSDAAPMAWIDWDSAITTVNKGRLPASARSACCAVQPASPHVTRSAAMAYRGLHDRSVGLLALVITSFDVVRGCDLRRRVAGIVLGVPAAG